MMKLLVVTKILCSPASSHDEHWKVKFKFLKGHSSSNLKMLSSFKWPLDYKQVYFLTQDEFSCWNKIFFLWKNLILLQKTESIGKRILRTTFSFRRQRKDIVPFWQKINLLWTAPITKFWTSQTFYFIFLAVFCFATLWPTCGNIYLDMVLWFWTAVILLELVCRVYMKYHVSLHFS